MHGICCHVCTGAPSCYLKLLDKLQKWIWRFIGSSLAASLQSLAHRRNLASLSLFCRYYFSWCSSELGQLVPLPYTRGKSTRYSDRLHDFPVTTPRCYKDVYVNSSFPRTAKLWNSLPIECFPLTYDVNGSKSRIIRNLFNCRFFPNRFLVCFNLFVILFRATPCLVVAIQWMKRIPIKKMSKKGHRERSLNSGVNKNLCKKWKKLNSVELILYFLYNKVPF